MDEHMGSAFDDLQVAQKYVATQDPSQSQERVGIVLGSGLGLLSKSLRDVTQIPYGDIPGMPHTAVQGHAGALLLGTLEGHPVACLSGRAHLYEGHAPSTVVFGVRLLAALRCTRFILTNAAGGIAPGCSPGKLMLIEDHLNLTGTNPLIGSNETTWGPRFPDMSEVYSERLRELAKRSANEMGLRIEQGVYAGLLGPSYETPAEIKMLRTLGASAVGMSTVHEAIALRHQGCQVLGISCITNWAAGLSEHPLSHEEVAETAGKTSQDFCNLVIRVVKAIH